MENTSSNAIPACRWCGKHHFGGMRCPDVKAMEFHPDGTVKRVEFYSPNDYAPISAAGPAPHYPTTVTWAATGGVDAQH